MAEVKHAAPVAESEVVVDRARDFWSQYKKPIIAGLALLALVVGGWLAYKYLIQQPKEKKAAEALFKAEEYFRMDSLNMALKGDGQFPGFEKVAKDYSSTKAGNLAKFYAGVVYLKQGDAKKAADMLDDFDTDAAQIKARAEKLLGDAYADQGKNKEALAQYKKAATSFEADDAISSEYLFMAAYFADKVMNNKKEAIDLYKQLKKKYPQTQFSMQADLYLAQNGVYSVED
jgi:predicted negative regulator of RcsB-dependent stress response